MWRVGRMVAGGIVAAVLARVRGFRPGRPDQPHRNDSGRRHAIGHLATGRTVAGDLGDARLAGSRGCRW